MRLNDKVALVCGAATGIGAAVVRRFSSEGAQVVACGLPTPPMPGALPCDVTDDAQVRRTVEIAIQRHGRIDVLVNAAGLTDRGTILDTSVERYDELFAVNVRAPFFLIQGAVKVMIREKIRGSIVNIQSMSAHGGQPFLSAYSTTKGALATLTRNLGNALVRHRIRVNGLNIGWMHTPGEERVLRVYHDKGPADLAAAAAAQPYGRIIDPEEVARLCLYLASDDSGLMSGSNIDFDQTFAGTSGEPLAP